MELKEFDPDGVGVFNGSYFGMPFEPQSARMVLISVPWDVTVSYGSGTAYAPDAIIEASTQLDFYEPLALDAWRRGIASAEIDYFLQDESKKLRHDAEKVIRHLEEGASPEDDYIRRKQQRINEGCARMNDRVEQQAGSLLDQDKLVGLVGGDHSTPYGLIRALGRRHERFGILHIDAHRDLRAAYEGFEFSHASIMYNVLRDVKSVERLTQVAVRDFSEQEAMLARNDQRIVSFDDLTLSSSAFRGESWDEQCRRIVETLPHEVYVSFDIDGLSFDNCPHTGTPVPGGLSFNQAVWLIHTLVESGRRIIGFDMVEVCPSPDEHDRTDAITGARILWKLANLTLKSNDPNK